MEKLARSVPAEADAGSFDFIRLVPHSAQDANVIKSVLYQGAPSGAPSSFLKRGAFRHWTSLLGLHNI